MANNKKSKNDTITRLQNVLDNDSKKKISDEDEQYIKSLIFRLEETPGRKLISKQKVVKGNKIDKTELLKPTVAVHLRKVKRKIEVKRKEKKKEVLYDTEIFEVEKVEIVAPKFIQVIPKETYKPNLEVIVKESKPKEELTEWEEIDIKPSKKIIEEKKESLPSFKQVKEPEKKIPFDWKSEEEKPKEEIVEFNEIPVSQEEHLEEKGLGIDSKIEVFKDFKSINEKTALLLYDNGYTSTDHLKSASFQDLAKIRGIKRRTAKKIKKELDWKSEETVRFKPVEISETAEEVKQDEIKEDVNVEVSRKPAPVESRRKTFKQEPAKKEKDLSVITKEPIVDESKKIEAFKEIKSIDENIAILLYDNGYKSLDSLKDTNVKDLTRLTGIKKRKAKKIKKELRRKFEPIEEPIEQKPEKEIKESKWATEYFVEVEEKSTEEIIAEAKKKKTTLTTKKSKKKKSVEKKPSKKAKSPKKKENVFKEIKSIDDKIADLLKKNNINSIQDLNKVTVKQLTKIRGIKRKTAKIIKKELAEFLEKPEDSNEDFKAEEKLRKITKEDDEWVTFDEEKNYPSKGDKKRGYVYKNYVLYEKEIPAKHGKNRVVRFFSKAEPAGAKPIELPKGYKVAKNQKTGVPYLKKKK